MVDKIDPDENIISEIALRVAAEKKLSKISDTTQELKGKTSEEIIHELQVHQIELEMQNDELKRVQLNWKSRGMSIETSTETFMILLRLATSL